MHPKFWLKFSFFLIIFKSLFEFQLLLSYLQTFHLLFVSATYSHILLLFSYTSHILFSLYLFPKNLCCRIGSAVQLFQCFSNLNLQFAQKCRCLLGCLCFYILISHLHTEPLKVTLCEHNVAYLSSSLLGHKSLQYYVTIH